MIDLALSLSVRWFPGEFVNVPVRDEGATDEVILFTEVNESFSVLDVASYPCIKVSRQKQNVVSCDVVNCHLQWVVQVILILFICIFSWGVGHDNGEFDAPCIQPYVE